MNEIIRIQNLNTGKVNSIYNLINTIILISNDKNSLEDISTNSLCPGLLALLVKQSIDKDDNNN